MRTDQASDPLSGFSAVTRAWFNSAFDAPTAAQLAAWQAIGGGEHALVVAPTGSGKTLAAFLHSLDRLAATPSTGGVRVLYISPLKALAADVERNLRVPLRGMQAAAKQLGLPVPQVRVAMRSGDSTANERRSLVRQPPDILITTPESLFLMLSSAAADTLSGVQTIIVDEVHAIAATKRGAHLALSLERLGGSGAEPQRVGLSATVNPTGQVASFLGGDRPVTIIEPPSTKHWNLRIEVPVDDMTELRKAAEGPEQSTTNSIWPFIAPRIHELIGQHRSTICFVNSRRVAERLTAQLNELHAAQAGAAAPSFAPPSDFIATSGASAGHDGSSTPIIARAHHGSVSKHRRLEIESDLKAGRLPCVVATSSLELGIDMGAVDLVIQVQAPPSVASALQRIGRAGHEVGAVSNGVVFPTARGDLLECSVVLQRMQRAEIEPLARLSNPLDVLAQQLVSTCLGGPRRPDELFRIVRRADAYRELTRAVFDAVVDMLCGRYPSEQFGGLRPRLARDQATGMLSARPGARMLVTTSGGTIPDRGNYGVFLVPSTEGGREVGRRVGELDEEMVYESRVGDVFTLGTTSWRIEQIDTNQVLVSPAPGEPGRLPFWHGDSMSRPVSLGRAIARTTGQLAKDPQRAADELGSQVGLDASASRNLYRYIEDQQRAAEVVPDERTIVVERFRDELGDWRVVLLSALGLSVLRPLAMVLQHLLRRRLGVEVNAAVTNDGVIMRVPDVDATPPGADLLDGLVLDEVPAIIEAELAGSALFAARFRECAARALLLPRRHPGQRSPLWQQRLRAAQLLQVAREYPDFPIVLEAMRECLHDVFDLPALMELLRGIQSRQVRVLGVELAQPSPFAQHTLFGYTGNFMYADDQPAAEQRLAALRLDEGLLDELLGRATGTELLEPRLIEQFEADLQQLSPDRRATNAEQLWDILARLGPLDRAELAARSTEPDWLDELVAQGRVQRWPAASSERFVVSEDLAWLNDEQPAAGVDGAWSQVTERLLARWIRTHLVVMPEQFAERYSIGLGQVASRLVELRRSGELVEVTLLPDEPGPQYCHRELFDRLKRRVLADLRAGIEPVDQAQFARFLPAWHELDAPGLGQGALINAVDQLAGVPIPASILETLVLPARVADYQPAMLDSALADGSVRWSGHGQLGERDGWVQLWPGDVALPPLEVPLEPAVRSLFERLCAGGAWRVGDLTDQQHRATDINRDLWLLAWAGLISTDSFAAVRQWCGQQVMRRSQTAPGPSRRLPRPTRSTLRSAVRVPHSNAPGSAVRWAALQRGGLPKADQLLQDIDLLLGRHGVLSRPGVAGEPLVETFASIYRLGTALEERGLVRRGYFVHGLGGAQFALSGAIDRLREQPPIGPLLLAAADPANPYGAALPWPDSPAHRPNRGAGSLVMLDDGALIAYLERGARTLLLFASDDRLPSALALLSGPVSAGRLDEITIERINGQPALETAEFHPALQTAGFVMVPQGFRLRR